MKKIKSKLDIKKLEYGSNFTFLHQLLTDSYKEQLIYLF